MAGKPAGWKLDLTGGATAERETTVVLSGVAALKYVNPDNATAGGWHGVQTEDPVQGTFSVPFRVGQTYTIRVASRVDQFGAGQQYRIRIEHHATEGTVKTEKRFIYKAANAWQVDVLTFITPATAQKHSTVYVEFNRNGSATTTAFYLDGLRVQEVTEFQFFDNGNVPASTYTIDWSLAPTQRLRLTGNVTLLFSGMIPGAIYQLEVQQDATGSRLVTWDPIIIWAGGGGAPTLTTTGNRSDLFEFSYIGTGGTDRVLGHTMGLNHPVNDVQTAVGTVLVSSADTVGTTYTISGLPFQPKLILFMMSGRSDATDANGAGDQFRSFGAAINTTTRRAIGAFGDHDVATTVAQIAESTVAVVVERGSGATTGFLDLDAINSDGFRLIVDDQFSVSHVVQWMAFGGTTFAANIGTTGTFVTGANSIAHGLGVAPSAVLLFGSHGPDDNFSVGFATGSSENWAVACHDADSVSTPETYQHSSVSNCIAVPTNTANTFHPRASLASFDATNFVLTLGEGTGAGSEIFWVAITGCRAEVGSMLTQTDTTTDTTTGSLGLRTRGIVMLSTSDGDTGQDGVIVDSEWCGGFVSVPATGGSPSQIAASTSSDDAVSPQNSIIGTGIEYNACYINLNPATGAKEGGAYVRSIDADSFTIRMNDADPASKRIGFLAVGV